MSGRFWEFHQLSDSFQGLSHFDQVQSSERLYIGGLPALYKDPDPLQDAGVTHVLSILDLDVRDTHRLQNYTRLAIQAEDRADEDLLQHLPKTTAFIDQAVRNGGTVFVHCAMGVSRSATVVMAFLMWKGRLSAKQAFETLKASRKQIRPNAGFQSQLEVWEAMVREKGGWDRETYERWKLQARL